MYYQIAMEVLLADEQEETVMRSIHRSPDLSLLLHRVAHCLNRKLGWAMTNSFESDNPETADVTLAVQAWTSYDAYLTAETGPQSSNPLTRSHLNGDPGSGTPSPGSISDPATNAPPPS